MLLNLGREAVIAGLVTPGFGLGTGQFTFSIANAASRWSDYAAGEEPSKSYAIFDAVQADAMRRAIAAWDEVIAPDFREIVETATTAGEVRVAFTDLAGDTGGIAYMGTRGSSGRVGDIWIDTDYRTAGFGDTDQAYSTLVHEIGHALGLKHSFETPALPGAFDDTRHTIMAYDPPSDGIVTSFEMRGDSLYATFEWVPTVGPTVLDIAAVQSIYGADTRTRTGDDRYRFIEGEAAIRTIWDAGGTDTIDLSNFTRSSIVDLRAGATSSIGLWSAADQADYWAQRYGWASSFVREQFDETSFTWHDNLAIAQGAVIENAIGGAREDVLLGNAAANRLEGGGGIDRLLGGAGDDTLVTGTGFNTAAMPEIAIGGSGDDRITANDRAVIFGDRPEVRHASLSGVQDFAILRGGASYTAAGLAAADHDLLVIDAARTVAGGREVLWSAQEVAGIAAGKLVLADFNLARIADDQAEWQRGWTSDGTAAGTLAADAPGFLGNAAPGGERDVLFWRAGWQAVLFARVDALVAQGFEGLLIDGISLLPSIANRSTDGADTIGVMRDLVTAVADHARAAVRAVRGDAAADAFVVTVVDPSALAVRLGDSFHKAENDRFFAAIDGVLLYDAFAGGDFRTVNDMLATYAWRGIGMFAAERGVDPAAAAGLYGAADATGFVLTTTPGTAFDVDPARSGASDRASGNDTIVGGTGNDIIVAGGGDDRIDGGGGYNRIDGGAGVDSIHYAAKFADATIARTDEGVRVIVQPLNGMMLATDTITNVEKLVFEDRTIDLRTYFATSEPAFALAADNGARVSIGGSGLVFGTSGAQSITLLDLPGRVTLDGSFNQGGDRVVLSGKAADWTAQRSGSAAIFDDGDTQVVVPIGQRVDIVFDDAAHSLAYSAETGMVQLSGWLLDVTPMRIVQGGVAPIAVTTDSTVPATLAFFEGGDAVAGGNLLVFGTPDGHETLHLLSGSRAVFDASFNAGGDTIALDDAASFFRAARLGSSVVIESATDWLSIPVGTTGATIRFAGVDYALRFDVAAGAVKLGDTALSTDFATFTV